MAIMLDIVSFDRQLAELPFTPILLNDYDTKVVEEKKKLNSFITRVYSSDTLDITPQCGCGFYNRGELLGTVCPNCKTVVTYPAEQEIRSTVWARVPEGIDAFINPLVHLVLASELNIKSFETMTWLIDASYRPNVKRPIELKNYLEQQFNVFGIRRGVNSFIQNFDRIMEILYKGPTLRGPKNTEKVDTLREFIRIHRDKFFSQYISFPAAMMFVIENTPTGRYADSKMEGAIDAIGTLNSIYHPTTPLSARKKENWMAKVQLKLLQYHAAIFDEFIGKKKGITRKNILGTLHPFTTRTVISSITANHRYYHLHFPYAPFTLTNKEHIQSKLFHRGYSPRAARAFVAEHVRNYHPMMSELHDELIADTPFDGIVCGFVRNPSLDRSSNQCLEITKVKRDPQDNTIGLSVMILKGSLGPVTQKCCYEELSNAGTYLEPCPPTTPGNSAWG